ncbi:hypothetical protein A3G56_02290 [Candidatus Falkowbacteria bacterium RIFCSPLOWO2_12_FULL_45_10]|uniref:Uncharacterized protein n=1 Tax=Candidatus Falkowbacteria bacterium RIFCSPLOWO2_12_FULL_45_10 TaxID=1797990 RepID=A0A1F5RW06_9BACT|nr:MAG: hypothetical protein A3G56_02290 [Candidatus Falkowbacteria bacterium RIFCSPLOWO2_12_FULL_45_10]
MFKLHRNSSILRKKSQLFCKKKKDDIKAVFCIVPKNKFLKSLRYYLKQKFIFCQKLLNFRSIFNIQYPNIYCIILRDCFVVARLAFAKAKRAGSSSQ